MMMMMKGVRSHSVLNFFIVKFIYLNVFLWGIYFDDIIIISIAI